MLEIRRTSYLVVFVVLTIILVACLSLTLARSNSPCSSCHGSYHQYLDILEGDSRNQIPTVVNVGETKNVSVVIQNYCDAPANTIMSGVAVNLESQNGHFKIEAPTYSIGTLRVGEKIATWQVTGVSAGTDVLLITAQGANNHNGLSFSDSYQPPPFVMIGQAAGKIQLSKAQIFFTIGTNKSDTFQIIVQSAVRNLTVIVSSNLSSVIDIVSPHSFASVNAEQNVTITLFFNGNSPVSQNGSLDIAWVDANGIADSTYVSVIISEPPTTDTTDTSMFRLTGRVIGLTDLGLVSASVGLSKLKMKKRLKVRLHCAVSWSLLALSVSHGTVLLIGPFAKMTFAQNVILGYASALSMGISSVVGLLQKKIVKATNYTTWLALHRVFLSEGIMLGVLHGLLIGTDFAIIRNLGA